MPRLTTLQKVVKFNKDLFHVGGRKAVNAFHYDMKNSPLDKEAEIRRDNGTACLVDKISHYDKTNQQYKTSNSAWILMYSFLWSATPGGRDYWKPIFERLKRLDKIG